MKATYTFILFFSCCLGFAQKTDSLKTRNFSVSKVALGIDILNAGMSQFQDRQLYQGYVSARIKKRIYAIAEAGYDQNIYLKGGYYAKVNGFFGKMGGFYMLSMDQENPANGFYAGAKLAASFYEQEYSSVPIRGYAGADQYLAFPSSRQSSYWLEGTVGAKVQLFSSPFFIDVNAQPRFMAYTTKQEEIIPMIVPGFGSSASKFNLGFSWNIAYQF